MEEFAVYDSLAEYVSADIVGKLPEWLRLAVYFLHPVPQNSHVVANSAAS